MNTHLIYRSTIFFGMIILLAHCKPEAVEETLKTTSQCRIQQSVNVLETNSHKQTETTDYAYDSQGNLTKTTFVTDRTDKDGKKSGSLLTVTYRYDMAGFLVTKTTENTINETEGAKFQSSETKTYSYSNNLLSTVETRNVNTRGNVSIQTDKYNYNSGGLLISRENKTSNGIVSIWSYDANGKLVDVIVRTNTGDTKPYTIQDGLITKVSGPGFYTVYQYNTKRQNIKTETFVNDKLNSYNSFEWCTSKPAESTLPTFKGFPKESYDMGIPGIWLKYQYFGDTGAAALRQLNESSAVTQKNKDELIMQIDVINQQMGALPTDPTTVVKSSQKFNYTGCN